VAQENIVIEAVPESGELKPGVENIVYIATVYPDGAPAQCDVTVDADPSTGPVLSKVEGPSTGGQTFRLSTGEYGLGELRFSPDQPYMVLAIAAHDEMGHTATLERYLEGRWDEEYVLLQPERASYRVGETMHLEVLTSAPVGTAYLSIVRKGQTISTRSPFFYFLRNGPARSICCPWKPTASTHHAPLSQSTASLKANSGRKMPLLQPNHPCFLRALLKQAYHAGR